MALQGRLIIYVAIAGLLSMLGFFTWYASLDMPKLDMAEIQLGNVEILNVNHAENQATVEVGFKIKNPSDKPFTIALVDYELFANGQPIGRGQYSAQDIPLPGRAIFGENVEIELPSLFTLTRTSQNAQIYSAIIDGQSVQYTAKGMMEVQSAWSLVEKEFDTSQ